MINLIFIYIITAFLGALAGCFFYWIYSYYKKESEKSSKIFREKSKRVGFLGRIKPFLTFVAQAPFVFDVLNKIFQKDFNAKKKQLFLAGYPGGITVEEFFVLKFYAFIFIPLICVIFFQEYVDGIFLIIIAFLSYIYPDFWLKAYSNERQKEITYELPNAIDTFALIISAGLQFKEAIDIYVKKSKPHPLVEEFRILQNEIILGKTWVSALKDMSNRISNSIFTNFSTALIQAESTGTSLSEVLTRISSDLKEIRFSSAEKEAHKAPIKIIIPLVVFIFPTMFIILFAPLILNYMAGK